MVIERGRRFRFIVLCLFKNLIFPVSVYLCRRARRKNWIHFSWFHIKVMGSLLFFRAGIDSGAPVDVFRRGSFDSKIVLNKSLPGSQLRRGDSCFMKSVVRALLK